MPHYPQRDRVPLLAALVSALTCVAACGDSGDETKATGGASASGGNGASSGSGGGGTGATGGNAGSPSGGSGGVGGAAGAAGAGSAISTGACPAEGCGCTHYVATDGSKSNDGLSPTNPWSIKHAFSSAEAGDVVCIAAGDYGKVSLVVANSGTEAKPIRFFGYRSEPGDVIDLEGRSTFRRGDKLDPSAMPLLDGGDGTGNGIQILDRDFVEITNIQLTRYGQGVGARGDNLRLENVIAVSLGNQTVYEQYDGFGIRLQGDDGVITRCFVQDANAEAIKVYGARNAAITFSDVYAQNPANPTDYYFLLTGDTQNSVIEDSVGYRELGLKHGGHGFDMKDQATNNTVRRCRAVHTNFELNFSGVHHNTFEDSEVVGADTSPGEWHAVIALGNGAHHNTFRNIWVHKVWTAISLFDMDDGYVGPGGDRDEVATSSDNTFVNMLVTDANRVLNIGGGTTYTASGERNYFYNSTFHNIDKLAVTYFKNDDTRFVNCAIDQVNHAKLWGEAGGAYAPYSKFNVSFDHCNFSNVSFAPPSGTAITTYTPGFVDAGGDNFALKASSELIDQGKTTPYAHDFVGTTRPQGSGFDLGAFERPSAN